VFQVGEVGSVSAADISVIFPWLIHFNSDLKGLCSNVNVEKKTFNC
jgi:hypothetical protein